MPSVVNKRTRANPNYHARIKLPTGRWTTRPTYQTTKAAAQRVANEMQARIMRGLLAIPDAVEVQRCQLTVAELAQKFLKEYTSPKVRDMEEYRTRCRSIFHARIEPYPLGSLLARDVRPLDMQAFREALRKDGYRPATINLSLSFMSRIYSWALEQELLEGKNPVSHIEWMAVSPSDDFYTMDHVHRLLAHPNLPIMAVCALYTGMRKGEVYGLAWSSVHLEDSIPRIEVKRSYLGPTKNGKPRTIPIHPELTPWLHAWRLQCPSTPEQVVFPVRAGTHYRMATDDNAEDTDKLRAFLKETGCPDTFGKPWHAFRHTFSTHFLEATGGNEDALAKLLGHTSRGTAPAVTRGYTHTGLNYLYNELVKLHLAPPKSRRKMD